MSEENGDTFDSISNQSRDDKDIILPTITEVPLDPENYQLGDRILDFFPARKFESNVPSRIFELSRLSSEAEQDISSKYMNLLACLPAEIDSRTDYILKIAKAKKDYILATKHLTSQSKDSVTGDDISSSSTPTGGATGGESRKTRLDGVDVSSLPAGFGKRRPSAIVGTSKKPKAPEESAPELEPGSNVVSREGTPSLI